MDEFKRALVTNGFKGELDDSPAAKDKYSHDASMFEVKPKLVVFPQDAKDVAAIVKLVGSQKAAHPELSLTGDSKIPRYS